jgi:predicted transcriptional regulator of viral defense system
MNYTLAEADVSENYSLAVACKKIPHGVLVIRLLSALRFDGLTTQAPFEVWAAVDVKARKPESDGLPFRIVRFPGMLCIPELRILSSTVSR